MSFHDTAKWILIAFFWSKQWVSDQQETDFEERIKIALSCYLEIQFVITELFVSKLQQNETIILYLLYSVNNAAGFSLMKTWKVHVKEMINWG